MSQNMYRSDVKVGLEATFFGKVMMFFALAIFASAAGVFVSMQYFMEYFIQTPGLMMLLYVVELGLVFTSRMWSTKAPLNRLLFFAFAFITGVTISPLIFQLTATTAGAALLYKALAATGLTFAATALVGFSTRKNLSGMSGFLFMGLIGMIIVGVIGIFIPWSTQFEMIYSGIGILLFSAFTAYDFQKIKHYPQDRYIDAALNLYLDIFNLFLYILRFLTALSRD